MSDYVQSLLSLPFGRVAELATEQLRYQQALVERQRIEESGLVVLSAIGGFACACAVIWFVTSQNRNFPRKEDDQKGKRP